MHAQYQVGYQLRSVISHLMILIRRFVGTVGFNAVVVLASVTVMDLPATVTVAVRMAPVVFAATV
jgi:hypothetical protein